MKMEIHVSHNRIALSVALCFFFYFYNDINKTRGKTKGQTDMLSFSQWFEAIVAFEKTMG